MREWMGRGRMVALLTVLVFAGTLAGGWRLAFGAGSSEKLAVADASQSAEKAVAPDFKLKNLQGKSVTLSQFKGKCPVLIEFFATYCEYCREAMPKVASLRKKISRKKLAILGIDVGSEALERLKEFEKENPSPYPILYDKGSVVTKSYGVFGIPKFVLVNERGEVEVNYPAGVVPDNIEKYLD